MTFYLTLDFVALLLLYVHGGGGYSPPLFLIIFNVYFTAWL